MKKIDRRTLRINSRCTLPQTRPLDQLSKNHSRPSALVSTLFLSFGVRCRSDARRHGLFEAQLPRAWPLEVRRAVGLDRSFVWQLWRPLSAGATRPVQQARKVSRKVSAAFATTHMPQVPSRSRFAVRARPPGRRVDRPQGRRAR